MSYCRFSCDDGKSDVYCYEDCEGGFTSHIGADRFNDPDLNSLWIRLIAAKTQGYHVPGHALDRITKELLGELRAKC